MIDLLEKLKQKRKEIAKREGKEIYRIFSNESLEATARARPKNKDELMNIKGWGPKRIENYSDEILEIVNNNSLTGEEINEDLPSPENSTKNHVFSVGDYLNLLNIGLRKSEARVKGEISSIDKREKYIFFSIKDKKDESMLRCFIWRNDHNLSGLNLEDGVEVIVWGYPRVYKPTGGLTFQALSVEPVGEGALKKAYEELKAKLEKEGLFDVDKKKALPRFPKRIGLITSKEGAVIHDFLNNLGKFGFKIFFKNSHVEGQRAVKELVSSVEYFKDKKVDVLVIIRGGGSLESLLPFNNEFLVRKLKTLTVPVLVGVGHDKDIPLVSMAADLVVSTPTATTRILNRSWEEAINSLDFLKRSMLSFFEQFLLQNEKTISEYSSIFKDKIKGFFESFRVMERKFYDALSCLNFSIKNNQKRIFDKLNFIAGQFWHSVGQLKGKLEKTESFLSISDPERNLRLGYSISYLKGKIIREIDDLEKGDDIEVKLKDGIIESKVKNKRKNN